jgi:hypothetical protein
LTSSGRTVIRSFLPLPSRTTIWFITDGIPLQPNALPDPVQKLYRWIPHN